MTWSNRLLFLVTCTVTFLSHVVSSQAAIQCYECHGDKKTADYRPKDFPSRDSASGGFQGNHQTHMAAPASPAHCASCHPGSAAYTSGHRDGMIKLSANINASRLAATYKNSTSAFPQTSTPVLGTCTNVNCHFESSTPTWGVSPFVYPADCNRCHGAPPAGGSTGAAGSHAKHDLYYQGSTQCRKCHADHGADSNRFSHATSAGRRDLVVSLHDPQGVAGGSYSGPVNDYMPGQANVFGSCSGLYCHSNGTSSTEFTANVTPTWGATLPANCTGCHNADEASASPIASGSHSMHIQYFGYGCITCHSQTVADNRTISRSANHVNSQVNVAFNNTTTAFNGKYSGLPTPVAKAPGSAYGSCENVYCHSNVQPNGGVGRPTAYGKPVWGTQIFCNGCHKAGVHGGSVAADGSTGVIDTGSHLKHITYFGVSEFSCARCHKWDSNYSYFSCAVCHSNDARPVKHANGKVEVVFDPYQGNAGTTYNGSPVPGNGYGSCSNSYCHSNGTSLTVFSPTIIPKWGVALPVDCSGCHGAGKVSAKPIGSGSHGMHIQFFTYSCATCHSQTAADNTTIAIRANHVNLQVNVAFNTTAMAINGKYNGSVTPVTKSPGTAYGSCENVYCHSNVQPNGGVGTPTAYGKPVWGTQIFCNGCHKAGVHGGSVAADGSTGVIDTGSHSRHMKYFGISEYSCARCHKWDKSYSYFSCAACHSNAARSVKHANGLVEVSIDPANDNTAAVYNGTPQPGDGYGSCANSYCHSDGTAVATGVVTANSSPVWGTSGPLSCSSCHGNATYTDYRQAAPLYSSGSPKANSHAAHLVSHQGKAPYGCNLCHSSTTVDNVSIATVQVHSDHVFNLVPAAGITFTYTYSASGGTCLNISCHRGKSATWGGSPLACTECHP